MSKWSDPKWIRVELERKWQGGHILRALLIGNELFPLRLPLKSPKNSEVNENFAEISQWIKTLKDHSKQEVGFGYELIEREMVHRQSGRNRIPTHVRIPTVDDALGMLRKKREGDRFKELIRMILAEWPALQDWIYKNPLRVLAAGDDWEGILAVLKWFSDHPRSGLYLRQLDIPGVDTKFIEQRKRILTELLDAVLPKDLVVCQASSFELRYGLRVKPVRVRLRLLDPRHYLQGLSDLTLTVEQLAAWEPAVSRVFITENEINGLCFPEGEGSVVIFGLGYGVDVLKTVAWLKEKEIYYWGDIDTHGFVMLDAVRSFLPQTKSILMEEEILFKARNLWSVEEKPFSGQLTRLTGEEYRLFCMLQDNVWGKGVRLEQERIAFGQVQKAIVPIYSA